MQTAVSIPRSVGLAAIGMRSAGRRVQVVAFGGHTFAVGAGAWAKGEPRTSMDYSAIAGPERRALFYVALAPALDGNELRDAMLVIGLPVPLLQDQEQARIVLDSLRGLKGEHTFALGDANHAFSIAKIKVVAQPVGAYVDWMYDAEMKARSGVNRAEVCVVDIGMNTLDLYVVRGGEVVESFIGGAEVGVRRLLEILNGDGRDITELDADLRAGILKPSDNQMDSWLGEVLAAIKRTLPALKRFTAVIPTDGGAVVLGQKLRLALVAKGAAVHFPDEPVTVNVRGFWKYGMRYA